MRRFQKWQKIWSFKKIHLFLSYLLWYVSTLCTFPSVDAPIPLIRLLSIVFGEPKMLLIENGFILYWQETIKDDIQCRSRPCVSMSHADIDYSNHECIGHYLSLPPFYSPQVNNSFSDPAVTNRWATVQSEHPDRDGCNIGCRHFLGDQLAEDSSTDQIYLFDDRTSVVGLWIFVLLRGGNCCSIMQQQFLLGRKRFLQKQS